MTANSLPAVAQARTLVGGGTWVLNVLQTFRRQSRLVGQANSVRLWRSW